MLVNIHSSQVLYLEREEKLTDQSNFVNDVTKFYSPSNSSLLKLPNGRKKGEKPYDNDLEFTERLITLTGIRCFLFVILLYSLCNYRTYVHFIRTKI